MHRDFEDLVGQIGAIGHETHKDTLAVRAGDNQPLVVNSIRDLPPLRGAKADSAIVVSAGPSLQNKQTLERIRDAGYPGSLVAIDASYLACLRIGLVPDYVLTLDPHPTRVAAWFGGYVEDPTDDYFTRQDLDIEFRKISRARNEKNRALIDEHGFKTAGIVSTTAPPNVVQRLREAGIARYWWNPLVDDPSAPDSLTRRLYDINQVPCMNTGGNVGTAAWVFANAILKIPRTALVGMDFAYYPNLPLENTQLYYELVARNGSDEGIREYFPEVVFPLTQERFYTDPTFFWYCRNFFELYARSEGVTVNCTEGGILFNDSLPLSTIDAFIAEVEAHG